MAALNSEQRILAAAVAPVNMPRSLRDGIENGAFATFSLTLVHGAHAIQGIFSANLARLALHGLLTLVAILAYYAVLHSRSIWPSLLVLGWLLFEILASWWLFDYRWGPSVFNLAMLPLAILAVRASWRRSRHSPKI